MAQETQHQVLFPTNITGGIDLLTPAGQRLRFAPIALAFCDLASGQSVVIAQLKDCPTELVPPNQVICRDAFDGLRADLRFTHSLAGWEQDVIVRQNVAPEQYGLSPQSTILQLITEFYDPPEPQTTERVLQRVPGIALVDQTLFFGAMQTGPSRGFPLAQARDGAQEWTEAVRWHNVENRFFLVESIEYLIIKPILDTLADSASLRLPLPTEPGHRTQQAALQANSGLRSPGVAAQPPPSANRVRTGPGYSLPASLPRCSLAADRPPAKTQMAKPQFPQRNIQNARFKTDRAPGLVLDFTLLLSDTDRTLKGDTTYYVSGTVNLSGTTTLEGGAVLKYTNTTDAKVVILGPLNCQTGPFRPAAFVAKDDDTVGDPISGSSGSPLGYYANPALSLVTGSDLKHIRIAHARQGIYYYLYNGGATLSHAQFVKCDKAIYLDYSTYYLRNVLLYQTAYSLYGPTFTATGENLTIDQCGYIGYELVPGTSSLSFVNSLLVQITNGCNFYYSSSYGATTNSSAAAFQTVGAASHYLAVNGWRNAGTTYINAGLLAELKKKTTYPPIVWSGNITTDTVLAPQALRDEDQVDIGYHYEPLDWVFNNIALSNAKLTLTNGVALGVYGTPGINLLSGAKLYSEGAPTNLNRIVRYQTVQEQQPTAWTATSPTMALLTVNADYATLPEVRLRFTDVSLMSDAVDKRRILYNASGYLVNPLACVDCQLRGGILDLQAGYNFVRQMTVALTNNLVHRGRLQLTQGYNGNTTPVAVYLRNNLFYGGSVYLMDYIPTAPWAVYDNLFDNVILYAGATTFPNDNNGYLNTPPLSGGFFNRILTSFTYATGPLGNYYQASTDLINGGNPMADQAGLYHYTTQTSQAKEAGSRVDIGLHYVALNGQNTPLDGDGDGLKDYFEDRNGDGVGSNDTYNWSNAHTHSTFPGDLQEYELSWNILLNDPVQDYANEQNTQSETTMIAFGSRVISAFVDSNLGVPGYGLADTSPECDGWHSDVTPQFIGWAISKNRGTTFADKGPLISVPTLPLLQPGNKGNAGDPVLARDNTTGTIYLVGNPQRPGIYYPDGPSQPAKLYVPLWRSLDNGETFLAPVNAAPGLAPEVWLGDYADKPSLVVDNFTGTGRGNVYLTFVWNRIASANKVVVFRSQNGGISWQMANQQLGSASQSGPILAVGPNHYVYLIWRESGYPSYFYFSKSTDYGVNFSAPVSFLNLNSANGTILVKRTRSSSDDDKIWGAILPNFVVNPVNGHLYLVYHDKPSSGQDYSNIYFTQSTDGGITWSSSPIQVNTGGITTDQWQPAIVVKPDGTKLFIAWYDRRDDEANNSLIKTYGVFATLPISDASSFSAYFPISTLQFPPVFTGLVMNHAGEFDLAYPPAERMDGQTCPTFWGTYSGYMGDYDTAVADNQYCYYTWGDNRDFTDGTQLHRHQPNVRFVCVSWP